MNRLVERSVSSVPAPPGTEVSCYVDERYDHNRATPDPIDETITADQELTVGLLWQLRNETPAIGEFGKRFRCRNHLLDEVARSGW